MKIALAQINPTVAAFKENAQRIASFTERAYPVRKSQRLEELKRRTEEGLRRG